MYIDDIKLLAKNEKELESQIQVVRIYSQVTGIEFANNEKRETTYDGRNRTTKSRKDQDVRRKGNLQVLGNIGSGHHQTYEDERQNKIEYLMRTRKLHEIELQSRNFIEGICIWTVPLVR